MMMMRNRSRAVRSKQGLMADQFSTRKTISSSSSSSSPISSFFGSPRFFNGYLSKNFIDSDTVVVSSPVSILDTKYSTLFVKQFDRSHSKSSTPSHEDQNHTNREAIGLALIDSIIEEKSDELLFSKPINRMVLLGSNLKVQIPVINSGDYSPPPQASLDSPKSPAEFGIKTKSPQLASPLSNSRELIRQLSLKEMELCEDYTCVITHGPNPKKTHIFDEYIVESCCGDDDDHIHETGGIKLESITSTENFLGFCYCCKDNLAQDKAIYIYRGDKGFCSNECRFKEMMLLEENGMKNKDADLNCSF